MKIIKVVHSNTPEEIEAEKQMFTIRNYDLDDYCEEFDKSALLFKDAVKGKYDLRRPSEKFISVMLSVIISEHLNNVINQLENIEVLSLEQAIKKYPNTYNLSVGTYTLHPYDGRRLSKLENYHKNLALEKDDELITLLGKMGAKTVRIVENDIQNNSGFGSLETAGVSINTTVNSNCSQTFESSKDLLVTFEGNIVEIDSDLLKNSLWFSCDSRLNAIYESRKFSLNKIKKYTLKNTYTETFNFDFELAAKYLVIETDLKAEYRSLSKKERLFHVEFGE